MINTVFGRVKYFHPNDANPTNWVTNEITGEVESRDQIFNPKLLTDLSLSWQFNSSIATTIGGHNLFNVYPDQHRHSSNISDGRFIYSRRVQQFGVKGAYYYMRLSLNL